MEVFKMRKWCLLFLFSISLLAENKSVKLKAVDIPLMGEFKIGQLFNMKIINDDFYLVDSQLSYILHFRLETAV